LTARSAIADFCFFARGRVLPSDSGVGYVFNLTDRDLADHGDEGVHVSGPFLTFRA
jgi:hypothetical protein